MRRTGWRRPHRRAPDVDDAGHAGAIEHVPGGRGAEDRRDHRVLGIAARHAAFDGAAQDRIVAVRDGGDADGRLGRAVAGEIAGELRVGPFHLVGVFLQPEHALEDDLGGRRHVEIVGLAFHQIDRLAADRAHHVVFADALGHRRAGAEAHRRLPADRDRDRHLLGALGAPLGDVVADMLGAPHQDRDGVAAGDHAAIDADVHDVGGRILGHDAGIGDEIAPAVEPVPVRRRQLVEIDVLADDDVLLARAGLDDARRHTCPAGWCGRASPARAHASPAAGRASSRCAACC